MIETPTIDVWLCGVRITVSRAYRDWVYALAQCRNHVRCGDGSTAYCGSYGGPHPASCPCQDCQNIVEAERLHTAYCREVGLPLPEYAR